MRIFCENYFWKEKKIGSFGSRGLGGGGYFLLEGYLFNVGIYFWTVKPFCQVVVELKAKSLDFPLEIGDFFMT